LYIYNTIKTKGYIVARKLMMGENPNIGDVVKTNDGEIREITIFDDRRENPYETRKGCEVMWIKRNDISEVIVNHCSENKVQDLLIYISEQKRAGLIF